MNTMFLLDECRSATDSKGFTASPTVVYHAHNSADSPAVVYHAHNSADSLCFFFFIFGNVQSSATSVTVI